MEDRKIRNITSDYLTCSICWNIYNDPKMLQCGHSYCAKCLRDYVCVVQKRKNCFECPECRHPQYLEPGSNPEDVIQSLRNDTVSVSILRAIGLQNNSKDDENSEVNTLSDKDYVDTGNNQVADISLSSCARHREKLLEVYCSKHEIAVCSVCASMDHSGPDCECSNVKVVIRKRVNALKCLVAQQASDVRQLFESEQGDVKTVKGVFEEFQKSVTEVEESFNTLYRIFKSHVESLRKKATDIVQSDPCSLRVKHLQDHLVEKIKTFDSDTNACNPNHTFSIISELCVESSDLQHNYHILSEKVKSGELMKHAEDDLHILDAFVSAAKQLIPERFQTQGEYLDEEEDDKDFVLVTNSGNFVDFVDEEDELSDISQHLAFSAKCPGEESCMLSGIALIGNTATVVVDQVNNKVKKFKLPEGKLLNDLVIENEPHQIAALKESDCVAVTLWEVPKILIVSTDPTLSVLEVIDTNIEYLGITSHALDHLALGSIQSRRVDVIDTKDIESLQEKRGVTIFQSSRRKTFPDRLTCTQDGRVIVRNRGRNEVCCFGRHELLWSRRLKRKISDIACFRGKVFASLGKKNRIVSFRDDGYGDVEQLNHRLPLSHPWAIDGFKDCLVVTEDSPSDKIHVFLFA